MYNVDTYTIRLQEAIMAQFKKQIISVVCATLLTIVAVFAFGIRSDKGPQAELQLGWISVRLQG